MCSVLAFFPGRRRLTNGMLSDLRAAGHYEGRARAMGWRKPQGHDAFADETAAIRQMVALRFRRRAGVVVGWGTEVDVVVWVVGHHKHDPDAWLLLGKAAVDGLADAGVVRRDRDGVELFGKVSRFADVGAGCVKVLRWGFPPDEGEPGFWLLVKARNCEGNEAAEVLP